VGLEGKAYPGVINIHDTENIHIENCRFGRNLGSEDVLHMAYVKGLAISDTRVEHAAKDAFDLEFVDGKMNRVQVIRAGDEALDLMASRLEVTDSVLLACGGNAVSAGEESELRLRDVLIAKSKVGVLAKNASSVDLIEALLYRNNIGLRIYRRAVRYQGDSRVNADGLFVVGSEQTIKTDKESREGLIAGHLQIRLPHKGGLRQLMNNVLGLEGPEKLDAWLDAQLGEPAP
ncbi:MAG: hypothetical protein JRF33_27635, partial [Deltaproteobacteria bacterium]|nr:hypothetical protein [Deltaproteobacteria bacterium]